MGASYQLDHSGHIGYEEQEAYQAQHRRLSISGNSVDEGVGGNMTERSPLLSSLKAQATSGSPLSLHNLGIIKYGRSWQGALALGISVFRCAFPIHSKNVVCSDFQFLNVSPLCYCAPNPALITRSSVSPPLLSRPHVFCGTASW